MNNELGREITIPSILKFTFPSILTMVVMSLYTVVDGTFVSRLVGTNAFSAVNIVYPLLSVTIGLGTMFGTGLTAVVSRKLGEGKEEEARQDLTFVLLTTILLGVAVTLVCFFCLEDIIRALGANDEIFQDCRDYAFPLVFFFGANILQLQFQTLYVACGKPYIGLATTVLGGLANVALDYLFIARFHMGVAGAAIATGIGYALPTVYGLAYFACNRKGALYFVKPKADFRLLLHTMVNGSSEMVNNLSTSVTTFLFNIIMMRMLGQDGVAAVSILLYLDFVLIAIALGYSLGVAPLFSYNYGSGEEEKLKRLFRMSTRFSFAVGAVMTTGTILFAKHLAGIFTHQGTPVYELAVSGLGIYALSYLFKGYNVFASALFTAFGDGRTSAILSFLRTFVFLSASLLGLSSLFGVEGVWFATPVAELLSLALSLFYLIRCRRRYGYWK